jgi:hypothetical protein
VAQVTLSFAGAVQCSADISADGRYRYRLMRRWGAGKTMLFVMLNPSTADATEDDPTIRRCLGFARREGCEALEVVNLFAYRATDPKDLTRCSDHPIGPANDSAIVSAAFAAQVLVVAWGGWIPKAWDVRPYTVVHMLERERPGLACLCLGPTTATGQPRHPLYAPSRTPLVPYALP